MLLDMCCDDLRMDLLPEYCTLLITTEEGLRMPENANEAGNIYHQ